MRRNSQMLCHEKIDTGAFLNLYLNLARNPGRNLEWLTVGMSEWSPGVLNSCQTTEPECDDSLFVYRTSWWAIPCFLISSRTTALRNFFAVHDDLEFGTCPRTSYLRKHFLGLWVQNWLRIKTIFIQSRLSTTVLEGFREENSTKGHTVPYIRYPFLQTGSRTRDPLKGFLFHPC